MKLDDEPLTREALPKVLTYKHAAFCNLLQETLDRLLKTRHLVPQSPPLMDKFESVFHGMRKMDKLFVRLKGMVNGL